MRLPNRTIALAILLVASFIATPSRAAVLFMASWPTFEVQYRGESITLRHDALPLPDSPNVAEELRFRIGNNTATLSQMLNGWAQFRLNHIVCVRVVRVGENYEMKTFSIHPFNTHPTPCQHLRE